MRQRQRCQKCGKRKEQKYMDQLGPKWSCKNCQDENRGYGKPQWRSTKLDQYGPPTTK